MTLRAYAGGTAERRALEAWRFASAGDIIGHILDIPALHTRQRGRCYLCIVAFVRGQRSKEPKGWSRDHVFPRAVGGGRPANVLLAHRDCNEDKAHRWPTPCEVIYLAAVYAPPYDALVQRLMRGARRLLINNRRRLAIERANA